MEFSVLKNHIEDFNLDKKIETDLIIKLSFNDFSYELHCNNEFPFEFPKIKIKLGDIEVIKKFISEIKLGNKYYGVCINDKLYLNGVFESNSHNSQISIFQYIKLSNNFFQKLKPNKI